MRSRHRASTCMCLSPSGVSGPPRLRAPRACLGPETQCPLWGLAQLSRTRGVSQSPTRVASQRHFLLQDTDEAPARRRRPGCRPPTLPGLLFITARSSRICISSDGGLAPTVTEPASPDVGRVSCLSPWRLRHTLNSGLPSPHRPLSWQLPFREGITCPRICPTRLSAPGGQRLCPSP